MRRGGEECCRSSRDGECVRVCACVCCNHNGRAAVTHCWGSSDELQGILWFCLLWWLAGSGACVVLCSAVEVSLRDEARGRGGLYRLSTATADAFGNLLFESGWTVNDTSFFLFGFSKFLLCVLGLQVQDFGHCSFSSLSHHFCLFVRIHFYFLRCQNKEVASALTTKHWPAAFLL